MRVAVVTAAVAVVSSTLLGCQPPPPELLEAPPPVERPAPPRAECAVGGPARVFVGTAPALASNAIVTHDARGHGRLHRLDQPTDDPIRLDDSVLAIRRRGDGWLVAMPGRFGELTIDGELTWSVELAVTASEAALAIDGDEAWLTLRDDEDEVSARRVDLRTRQADSPVAIGRGRGRLVAGAARGGWTGHDGVIWSPNGELELPGVVASLAGTHIVYAASDRTGLWLGTDPAVRLTQPHTPPSHALAHVLGQRLVVAYTFETDLFVQLADADSGALGEPTLVAASALVRAIAVAGERFWLAWERGPHIEVRAGECNGEGA